MRIEEKEGLVCVSVNINNWVNQPQIVDGDISVNDLSPLFSELNELHVNATESDMGFLSNLGYNGRIRIISLSLSYNHTHGNLCSFSFVGVGLSVGDDIKITFT